MSSSAQPPKLTKKQKKGLAFRERKSGKLSTKDKGKHGQSADDEAGLEVPIEENQDLASLEVSGVEVSGLESAAIGGTEADGGKGKGKAADTGDKKVWTHSKKRKREEGEASTSQSDKPKSKKKKRVSGDIADETRVTDVKKKAEAKSEVKQRFILFVGEHEDIIYFTT